MLYFSKFFFLAALFSIFVGSCRATTDADEDEKMIAEILRSLPPDETQFTFQDDTSSSQPYLRWNCDYCSERFRIRKLLRDHIRFQHKQNNLFVCSLCHIASSQSSILIEHVETVHRTHNPTEHINIK